MATNSEKRILEDVHVEQRADGEGRRIVGYAAVFNTPADIGGMFREQVMPGAFADAIGRDDVRALIDHDPSKVLGRTRAGTLRMEEDERGLRVEIDPPDTQIARDLMASMERGDINQMSFAFRATRQTWDDDEDPPMRSIEAVELFDVSVVTYPAYEETEAALRSLEEARKERRQHNFNAAATRLQLKGDLDRRVRSTA